MITAIVNQKGGVGKTTTATNLATALAACRHKVLVIDLDPQGNSSTGFGIQNENRKITIYEVLHLTNIKNAINSTLVPNLDIITSNVNLSAAEIELVTAESREFVLKSVMEEILPNYDHIIIDCPPSLGLLTINALNAATNVLIPMQCEFYALEGLSNLLKTVEIVQKRFNPNLKILGILLTMYDRRNKLTQDIEHDVRKCMQHLVFKTIIPRNIRISEAPSFGKPVMLYDHKCIGSVAYMHLAKEILQRGE